MEICGDCKYWNTTGFGSRNGPATGIHRASLVGECTLVARHWFPCSPQKFIGLNGTEHSRWPELIAVITRREFGCNQFTQNE